MTIQQRCAAAVFVASYLCMSANGFNFGTQFLRAKQASEQEQPSQSRKVSGSNVRSTSRTVNRAHRMAKSKSKYGSKYGSSTPPCDLTITPKECTVGTGPTMTIGADGVCMVDEVTSDMKCDAFDPLTYVTLKYFGDKNALMTCTDDKGEVHLGPDEPIGKQDDFSLHFETDGSDKIITCTLTDCKDKTTVGSVTFQPKALEVNGQVGTSMRVVQCGGTKGTTTQTPLTAYQDVSVKFHVENNVNDVPVTIDGVTLFNPQQMGYYITPTKAYQAMIVSPTHTGTNGNMVLDRYVNANPGVVQGTFTVDTAESKTLMHQILLSCQGTSVKSDVLSPAVSIQVKRGEAMIPPS